MTMDIAWVKFGFDVMQTLLTALIGLYVWIDKRNQVSATRINRMEESLDTRLDDVSQRLAHAEERVGRALDHDDLRPLFERLNKIADEVAHLSGSVDALRRGQDLIHQHLLREHAK
jgi:hypothetical protein